MNSRARIVRALSKVIDVNEVDEIIMEVDFNFLESLLEVLRDKYQGRSRLILKKMIEALMEEDPVLAEKVKKALERRP